MYITKREFNTIKTLKRFLTAEEFKDFKELINKNVNSIEIEIDNEIKINYYNIDLYERKELVYSMIIERTLGFKAKYSLSIRKSDISKIEKYIFKNDIALRIIKQLKSNDIIAFENISREMKMLRFEKATNRVCLIIENKKKLKVLKP
jgi:hypothetical protein